MGSTAAGEPDTLTLRSERFEAVVVPSVGGGLAALDALAERARLPLLRPVSRIDDPLALGFIVLAPFSNRIDGGFTFEGRRIALTPNVAGERYPIHGDAFQGAFVVEERDERRAALAYDGAFGPYRYRARLIYELGDECHARLALTNTGPRLPFGGGFHPYFLRTEDTALAFHADGVFTETADHLGDAHIPATGEWSYASPRALPAEWLNNAFTGWNRRAAIQRPADDLSIEMVADPPLDVLIVHSRTSADPFVCVEPVSHVVNAHNMAGMPGLFVLEEGETLQLAMRIGWRRLR